MGKGRLFAGLLGAGAVLYGGNLITPGSSATQVTAARDSATNIVQGVAGVAGEVVTQAGPLVHDAMGSLQSSGIGNVLSPTTPTTAPGTVPPAQQPSTAQP